MPKPQGFLIEGYQSGVLGDVQETEPFLDAIGVKSALKPQSVIRTGRELTCYSIPAVRKRFR